MTSSRGDRGPAVAAALLLLIVAAAAAAAPTPLGAQRAPAAHRGTSPDAVAAPGVTAFSRAASGGPASGGPAAGGPAAGGPAPDEPPIDDALRIGFRAGAYFPNDGKIRDVFGDVFPALGLATVTPVHPNHGRFFPALELFGTRSGKNHFFVVPLTLVGEYQLPAGSGRRNNVPFVRGEAGIAYFDYRIARGGAVVRSRRGGAVGSVDAGVLVSTSFRVGARYRILQHFDGYDFGGVELYTVIGSFHIL
jgi:hypothetical protein